MYSKPMQIGNLTIKNRFVRSATYEKRATADGAATDELVGFYRALAEGGVGLIITGFAYIQPNGRAFPNQTAVDRDDLIPKLSKISEVIHKYGDGCKVVAQIGHCGRESYMVDDMVDPSGIEEPVTTNKPVEMTIEEIEEIIENFTQAARRVSLACSKTAGVYAAW